MSTNEDRNKPGLQYPQDLHKDSVPVQKAFKMTVDNLFFLHRRVDEIAAAAGAPRETIQQLINQTINQTSTGGGGGGGGPAITVLVSTHAVRLGTYGGAALPIGTLFIETDRCSIYYISDAYGVPRWVFAAGMMSGAIASQPTDLGTFDAGFSFVATDATELTHYLWTGTTWITNGGLRQVITDAVTAASSAVFRMAHRSSGTPAASFGAIARTELDNNLNVLTDASELDTFWTTATSGAETAAWAVRLKVAGAALADYFQVLFNGIRFKVAGFFGKFTHANSADRTYTMPDADGNITYETAALTNNNFLFGGGLALVKDAGFSVVPVANGGTGSATGVKFLQFRLTLSSGNPVYNPIPATPSSTDTGAETVTFAADHNWTNGTIATVSATGGGLTAGTRYFLHVVSATSISFHTSVADAISGSSPVNLTASITALIITSGVSNTTLYLTPFNGDLISLYNGSVWLSMASTEVSIALGTLTSGLPYDVFAYDSSGTLTLELVAWTSGTVRATALAYQDGVPVKSGTLTKRLVGTIYTDSTTTTIDDAGGLQSKLGGKRFVSNVLGLLFPMIYKDLDGSWNYSVATWRAMDGASSGAKNEFVQCLSGNDVDASYDQNVSKSNNSSENSNSIGFDSITVPDVNASIAIFTGTLLNSLVTQHCHLRRSSPAGYHYVAAMERGSGTVTSTWYGYDSANNNRLSMFSAITLQ